MDILKPAVTYENAPLLIYWEMTQACDLACRHCRASAVPERDPQELSTEEALRLLEQIAAFRDLPGDRGSATTTPTLILTGGDPLKRADLFDLVARARGLGLQVGLTPSGTRSLTAAAIERFLAAGINVIALSIDGSTAERHDRFRNVPGCFVQTVAAARHARRIGMPVQINTTVCGETLDDLDQMAALVADLETLRWSLFFLVPIGRGEVLGQISRGQCERVLHWLHELSQTASFQIKTTEAHHYRRVVLQRVEATGGGVESVLRGPGGRGFGIRDGAGVVFVSHRGDVYPSGFLPLAAGNVRRDQLVELYRDSEIFCRLRDADSLRGKCGRCEYRWICGGSRARAFAMTGDPMAADPLCAFVPGAPA